MFYRLPENLAEELDALEEATEKAREGDLDAGAFDKMRVAYGSYEQRAPGVRMVRIRTPAGAVSPAQLRGMADISHRYGSTNIHVTTRQEFQIHNLRAEDIVAVMRDLMGIGLATRGGGGGTVRNILVTPEAGLTEDEVFDPSPHAFALMSRLIADPTSWQLPRKFKISFANCAADGAYALLNDVGFVARIRGGVRGFQVFVVGGAGNKPEIGHLLHDFIDESDTWIVAEAIKRVFSKYGDRENRARARLRFLWKSLREEVFRTRYEEEYEAIVSEAPPSFTLEPAPEVPDVEPVEEPAETGEEFALWRSRYVAPQKRLGRFFVRVPLTMGNIDNDMARLLADFLEPLGEDTVRADFGQNLRLRNIPEDRLPFLWRLLKETDSLIERPRLLGDAIACTGAETCKLGICRSKGMLAATTQALALSSLALDDLAGFKLNVSGCPNACGQHLMADLGFSGGASRQDGNLYPVYTIFVGATAGVGSTRLAQAIGKLPARIIPAFVVDLLEMWLAYSSGHETFGDWALGNGAAEISGLIERHSHVPTVDEDESYYVDWTMDERFSVGKG